MSTTATLLLVRHGQTDVTGSVLAGWTPGIGLDEQGRRQTDELADRLAGLELADVISSPLQRCRETARLIVERGDDRRVRVDERFAECRYGEWTGKRLEDLAAEPLWRVVQDHPSAARFPGGESLAEVAHRAVNAVREHNDRLTRAHRHPVYLVCSHGDVIKAIVADALGAHLDHFQRIQVSPCSLTAIRYTETRPFVLRLNDVGGAVTDLVPREGEVSGDATVGGGASGRP